jgi:hypothetical protein
MTIKASISIGTILLLLTGMSLLTNANATEIIYDKNADLPICMYKVILDCKTKSGLICEADTTIDPCQDIFHGFTGTDENYRPDTEQFIVPLNSSLVQECWNDGYNDGKNGGWNQDRQFECIEHLPDRILDPYRDALEVGCRDGGYPEENCDEINH